MAKLTDETRAKLERRSRLVNLGRDAEFSQGFINVPPFRGSTVLYPDVATLKSRGQRFTYGTRGTPTTEALCSAWTDLSGAAGTVLVPSGLAAVVVALMTALSAGDHLLITDSVYEPSRAFAERLCVASGSRRAIMIRPWRRDRRADAPEHQGGADGIPGSQTLEVQDIPAIAEVAHARGACVILDNTWATPLFFSPHAHGVDLAVEAGTKYLSGHADLLLGLVSANEAWFQRLHRTIHLMAIPPGAEDVFLALRGLRTMELRLREAERQGLALAQWLSDGPRSCASSTPLCPIIRARALEARLYRLLGPVFDRAEAGVGGRRRRPSRWPRVVRPRLFLGGYESLAVPFDCTATRTATRFAPGGPTVRFSVGLEDIEDLRRTSTGASRG